MQWGLLTLRGPGRTQEVAFDLKNEKACVKQRPGEECFRQGAANTRT